MARKKFDLSADILKVVAHPTRLAILDSLKNGTKCVTDVAELLSTPQVNISQHLSILRREGVVTYVEQGSKRCYSIVDFAFIKALLEVLETRSASSERHLAPLDEITAR